MSSKKYISAVTFVFFSMIFSGCTSRPFSVSPQTPEKIDPTAVMHIEKLSLRDIPLEEYRREAYSSLRELDDKPSIKPSFPAIETSSHLDDSESRFQNIIKEYKKGKKI